MILAVFIDFSLFSLSLALIHNFWFLTAFVICVIPNNCLFGMYEIAITCVGWSCPVSRVRSAGSSRSGLVGRDGRLLSITLKRVAGSQLESDGLKSKSSAILTSARTFAGLVDQLQLF